ncbi:hypothetical protein [Geodermatophilus amargosae]|uniref:hypothetical protein n=1 Tax=Geodermatophilus amargosae TaxID=1296565 RepID=UPI00111488CE|nr:hypothetical protein [Geodermatophilus amargosae]
MLGSTSGPASSAASPTRASVWAASTAADERPSPVAPATGVSETAAIAATIPSAHALAPMPGMNRADRTPRRFLSMCPSP